MVKETACLRRGREVFLFWGRVGPGHEIAAVVVDVYPAWVMTRLGLLRLSGLLGLGAFGTS